MGIHHSLLTEIQSPPSNCAVHFFKFKMKNKDCGDCKNDERELCKKHSIEEIERALQSLENDPQLPPDHSSNSNSSNNDHDDSYDDIQVVKADIYKFHGQEETSLDQQVNEGILKFEFRDED